LCASISTRALLNRPFDDLGSRRVRQEAEAVTMVVSAVEARQASLVSSEYLAFEIHASAEAGRVDLLVTTDVRMLRRCRRAGARLAVRVVTPLEALAALAEEVRK